MRALVIGASGQVGAALVLTLRERGHEAAGTYARSPQPGLLPLDVTDAVATATTIAGARPDWVFCPAGLTAVDYLEDHPDEAFRVNRDAPALAARAAARQGAGFVYYSTEYVFDGKAGPYAEDDPTHPISVYGASKLAGEEAVCEANPRTLVIRTTVVYGPEPQGKNFVYQILRRAKSGEGMRVPTDQVSSPTYNRDLALATVELAERDVHGVCHVVGDRLLDRFTFARLACEVFALDPGMLAPVTTAELSQRAARPLQAGLRIDRVRAVVGVRLRPPVDGLVAMRRELER